MESGEEIQPEENVQVYIPIPEKMKLFAYLGKTKIYRVEADGTLTEMDVKIKMEDLRLKHHILAFIH